MRGDCERDLGGRNLVFVCSYSALPEEVLQQAEDGGVESWVYSFRPPARLPGLPALTAGKSFGESSTDLSSCFQAQGGCNCYRFLSQGPEM